MSAHLYLSPHLDDAVFSCGGLMALQDARGDPISVLTLFAGDPPDFRISSFAAELHARWGQAGPPIAIRRAEDRVACGRLGSSVVHLSFPDSIYRLGPGGEILYENSESLFGPLREEDEGLVDVLVHALQELQLSPANIYCPGALGGHVDHRLTRMAAERLGYNLIYYQDFPYATRGDAWPEELGKPPGAEKIIPLTPEALETWGHASSEYRTQLSTFWESEDELYDEIREFHDASGGVRLILPVETNPRPV
jgi:LmbE family N-acetylglucosaminyl deacetylase